MNFTTIHDIDKASVLAEALINAGKNLGMNRADLGNIIGKNRSAISRGRIEHGSKAEDWRCCLSAAIVPFYVLGGNYQQMQHWMQTENIHTGGIPAEQAKSIQGLVAILEYLDAMRGKL